MTMIQVMRQLAALPKRRYTYRLFVFPETIGSCALLASRPDLLEAIRVAIFAEFVGWGDEWVLSVSNKPDSLTAMLAAEMCLHDPSIRMVDLFGHGAWGNDEFVFDYAGIPSMAIQKFDCPEYHSSNDDPSRLRVEDLQRAAQIVYRMCRVAEEDTTYDRTQSVPIYLTRYDLYLDAVDQRAAFKDRRTILYGIDGEKSLLDIAVQVGIDFDKVKAFSDRLYELGLIRKSGSVRR